MKPDVTNILAIPKEGAGSGQAVVVRHRTFPEIHIERGSMVEGLEALLRALEQSNAWTGDEWHRSALGQAIVEVETALTLVAPTGYTRMVHDGYSVTRLNDLVYIFDNTQDPGDQDEAGPDDLRPELDHDHSTFIQIFAGGRRCVNRRRVVGNGAGMPDGIERRSLERRKLDRRGLNRLAPIAETPLSSDALNATALEGQNLPLSEF
jgi:hypothetical protein